jgi:hypothetical protein
VAILHAYSVLSEKDKEMETTLSCTPGCETAAQVDEKQDTMLALNNISPVGPWRSWERASMASRRSWVRIPSAPPTLLVYGPERSFTERSGEIVYTLGPKGLSKGCRVL